MTRYPIYSGGMFIETPQVLEVINPYTGLVFASTFLAGRQELEQAITAADAVREEVAGESSFRRYEVLMNIARAIAEGREKLAQVLAMESGKPVRYALGEVDRATQVFIIAAEEAKRLPREYLSLDWTPAGKGKEGLVRYFPRGLVAAISPFNFPLNLAVHKIAPAIASGHPIILKPARSTPLSTLELAKILHRSGVTKGSVSILPMDRETGNSLVTDPRFSILSFTGSVEVGWKMKQDGGRKKVLLELGGNAGVIVTESADIGLAVAKCLTGGFAYSGQICIHVQRIFIHQKVFNDFTSRFVAGVRALKPGDPLDPATEISVMIDEENAIRVEEWIREAVDGGATLLTGGKREGRYVEPAVLTSTIPEMRVCSQEVFGPVVVVEPYHTFDEAANRVNASSFGLQAGVFTRLREEENRAFSRLEVGAVIINDVPAFRVDHMPYGGIKESGLGREGVRYSILEMMEPKLLVRDF